MNTDKNDGLDESLNELTKKIIGCSYAVSNELGVGFLEKVYENALVHELGKAGIVAEQQKEILVRYDSVIVGHYTPDVLVDGKVIVELKAIKGCDDIHSAKCINYLKATGMPVCLLINFGQPRVQVKRFVL
jgi:GxxExxY protein